MVANAFKYLPKSDTAVYTCYLKKLFISISDNSQENACAFHFKPISSYCFKTIFIHSRSTFLF